MPSRPPPPMPPPPWRSHAMRRASSAAGHLRERLRAQDAACLLGGAAALGPAMVLAPAPTAALWTAWTVLLHWAGRGRLAWLALGLCAALSVRARHQLWSFEQARAAWQLSLQSPRRCEGSGVVAQRPARLADGGWRLLLQVDQLHCASDRGPWHPGALPTSVLLRVPEDVLLRDDGAVIARGGTLRFEADLAVSQRMLLAELADPRPRQAAASAQLSGAAVHGHMVGDAPWWFAWLDGARARTHDAVARALPADVAPLTQALLLGERVLESEEDSAFARSGLAHLLAVSGMHLVLAVEQLRKFARWILVRTPWVQRLDVRRALACAVVPLSLLYADFAGGSGSAWRAAWSLALIAAANACERPLSPWRALGGSVLLMACLDPMALYDVSFVLSVLATVGLLTLGRPCTQALAWLRWPSWLQNTLGPSVAASVLVTPALARLSDGAPSLSLLLNALAIPLSESVALPLALLFAALPELEVLEPLRQGVAWAVAGALRLTRQLAYLGASWPLWPLPWPTAWQLAVLAAFGWALFALVPRHDAPRARWRQLRHVVGCTLGAALALGMAEWTHLRWAQPRGELRLTALDVGQGDSLLLDLPDGSAMLVDGGGLIGSSDVGERVLAPVLRARRRKELALVVVSHAHPDHYGGLGSGLRGVHVRELWEPSPLAVPSPPASVRFERGSVAQLRADYLRWRDAALAQGTRRRHEVDVCGVHAVGGAAIEVLWPCPSRREGLHENDLSLVLRVHHQGAPRILLVGDAEREAEQALLASGAALHAPVLKLGHHGSRTSSSPEFVAAVAPSVALLSAGARNRHGHPHQETLRTLEAASLPLWRTDREGAIELRFAPHRLSARASSFWFSEHGPLQ